MSFKKISDVALEESASPALNIMVEDDGELKRLPWDFVMQAQTGAILMTHSYSELEDWALFLPDDEFYALAAAIKNGTNVVCTITGVPYDTVTCNEHFTCADSVVCEGKDSEAVAGGVWDGIGMWNTWCDGSLYIMPEWEKERDD